MKRDIDFLFEIGCFRFIERMWRRFFNPDVQNNAEHTFRVAWIALILAKREGITNHEKILKMALMHDIPESRAGDVDFVSRLYVKRDEDKAMADMVRDTSLQEDIMEAWTEYEKRESIESRIVKDADNLDVEFELLEIKSNGHGMGVAWSELRKETVYKKLFTDSAKQMCEEIRTSNPHGWYVNSNNRFNEGDWKK